MLTRDDLLAAACNPLHTVLERENFWRQYEVRSWVEAVRKRGLLLTSFDDVPKMKQRILAALRAEDATPLVPLPKAS